MDNGKFYAYAGIIATAMLIISYLFIIRGANRFERRKCDLENALEISRVIKSYKTNIQKETSTILLETDKVFHIPRSSKEMLLKENDTIQKVKGENIYIINRYDQAGKIDTFIFDCSK
jgi:hypothetical protein